MNNSGNKIQLRRQPMNPIERSLLINSTYLSASLGQIHVLLAIDSLQNFNFRTVQSRQAQAMLLPIKKKQQRQANIEKARVFYDRKRAAKTMAQQDPTTLAVAFDFQKPCRDRLIIVDSELWSRQMTGV